MVPSATCGTAVSGPGEPVRLEPGTVARYHVRAVPVSGRRGGTTTYRTATPRSAMRQDSTGVAIVGGGAAGAATAWVLARRGVSVTLFEQHAPGHPHGSSHGSSRAVRVAHPDPAWVRTAQRSLQRWRALEEDTGTALLATLGGLDHGSARDVHAIAQALAEVGVSGELLEPEAAAERWPGVVPDGPVLHQGDAGRADADATVAALHRRVGELGGEVRWHTPVQRVRPQADGARIETAEAVVHAQRVVVTAGAWTASLLGDVVALPPLAVTQEQFAHLPAHDGDDGAWPVLVHKRPGLQIYGMGVGAEGVKIGEHMAGAATSPQRRDARVDPDGLERVRAYVQRWLPGLEPRMLSATTCLYTSAPQDRWVADRAGPLVVISACSGQGFKHVPLVGEIAADLAEGRGERPDHALPVSLLPQVSAELG